MKKKFPSSLKQKCFFEIKVIKNLNSNTMLLTSKVGMFRVLHVLSTLLCALGFLQSTYSAPPEQFSVRQRKLLVKGLLICLF